MKKSFLLIGLVLAASFFLPTKLRSQPCPNIDFRYGDFTHWTGYLGSCSSGNVIINPAPINPSRHSIMVRSVLELTGQLMDEKCPAIPKIPPGFNYAAKLGNSSTGAEMEALEYTLTVDSSNSLLIVHYAWIMEDPYHSKLDQPRFTMTIKDSLGINIPNAYCPCTDDDALVCKTNPLGKDWTAKGINLLPFMGQKIKIYFETRDCALKGHYGYAYIVPECRPMKIDFQFCAGSSNARMSVPQGYTSYTWKRSTKPGWSEGGPPPNGRFLIVNDAQIGEIFTCYMSSGDGWWCYCPSESIEIVITETIIDANFAFGVKDANGHVPIIENDTVSWYDTCARTATFVDLTRVIGNTKNDILWEIFAPNNRNPIWQQPSDSLFTFTFPDPDSTPVTYRVRLTAVAENGCSDTSESRQGQFITIYPSLKIKIEGETEMCEGGSQWLKAKRVRGEFTNHTWSWTDANDVIQTATGDSIEIFDKGIYILISENNNSDCFAVDSINVVFSKPMFASLDIRDVNCHGEATGEFSYGYILGGTPPYFPLYWLMPNESGGCDTLYAPPGGARFSNLKAGTYRCEGMDITGCLFYEEFEIKPFSLEITGEQHPSGCYMNVKLTATGGRTNSTLYNYKVEKEDGTLVHFSTSDLALNLSAGKYIITVIDYNACEASDTIDVVEHNGFPLSSVHIMGGNLVIDINQDTMFNLIFMPANACNKNIIWHSEDTTIATVDANGIVRGISNGETYIVVTSVEGGFQASRKVRVGNVGLKTFTEEKIVFSVYPNPAYTQLNVRLWSHETANYTIYNVVGQIITHGKLQEVSTINIASLTNGMYYLKVGNRTVKIIKAYF